MTGVQTCALPISNDVITRILEFDNANVRVIDYPFDYYRFAEDLNVYERRETRDQAARKGNMDLLFINLGKMDHIGPKDLLVMICQVGKLKAHQIGDIRLKGAYSFIEVPANASQTIIQAFNGFIYRGRRVRLEIRNDKEESFSEKRRYRDWETIGRAHV